MRILITGGTGLLGNNLIRQSLTAGHEVVALVRSKTPPKSLEGLNITISQGDVTDKESIMRAADGCQAILHSAAQIHIGWKQRDLSMQVNREGTRNVVEVARKNLSRLVHVSTVNTLAIGNREGTVDEESRHDGQVPCTYVLSKRASEQVVVDAIRDGLEGVIVHPGFMLGPWDWKPSSGRMILEVGKLWTPISPSGGCSVCDVRDVADGVLKALDRGTKGRHYILAGENLSYFDLWSKIKKAFGKGRPLITMRPLGRFVIGRAGDIASLVVAEPTVNSAAIQMSSQFHCYSSQRAIDELGYRVRPADESIAAAVSWFKEHGYV